MSLPEGISSFESWWDDTNSFLRVMKGGEALAIIDNRLHRIKQLFDPGEYETLLGSVPAGEVAFVPYSRYSPGMPEGWYCLTIVILGSDCELPIMCQFAFSCSIEKLKQGPCVERIVYGILGMQLNIIVKQVGGDPDILWKALNKLSQGE